MALQFSIDLKKDIPDVLLNGDHARIEQWRQKRALAATRRKRPTLIKNKVY